jgi:4-hydroxybenzoyl-CoA reductase subunit beta
MSMLPDFRYVRPTTVADAVAALVASPTAVPVAGASDLLPNLRRGLGNPEALIDLAGIAALATIEETATSWRIGAVVSLADLVEHKALHAAIPAIGEAALSAGGPTHRAGGTIGGNLCQDTRCMYYNQSEWWREGNDFCLKYEGDRCHVAPRTSRCFATYRGDVAPTLMVLDAKVEIAGPAGTRTIPLAELFVDDGAAHLALAPGEILTVIEVPKADRLVAHYAKLRIRDSIDFPLVGVAAALKRDGDKIAVLRVAITGTNSAPVTVALLDSLVGHPWSDAAAKHLTDRLNKTAKLQNTVTTSMKYRRRVLLATARRLVEQLWEQAV